MSYPNYMLVVFDEAKEKVPSNQVCKYLEKRNWQSLQDDLVKDIWVKDDRYLITDRCSFSMGDVTGKTMVLVLNVKKVN